MDIFWLSDNLKCDAQVTLRQDGVTVVVITNDPSIAKELRDRQTSQDRKDVKCYSSSDRKFRCFLSHVVKSKILPGDPIRNEFEIRSTADVKESETDDYPLA